MKTRYVFGGTATAVALALLAWYLPVSAPDDSEMVVASAEPKTQGERLAGSRDSRVGNERPTAPATPPESRVTGGLATRSDDALRKSETEAGAQLRGGDRDTALSLRRNGGTATDELSRVAPAIEEKRLTGQMQSGAGRPVETAPGIAGPAAVLAKPEGEVSEQSRGVYRAPQDTARALGKAQSFAAQDVKERPAARPHRGDAQVKQYEAVGRDQFSREPENGVKRVAEEPVSTFSIDVDTASYAFMRRMINSGTLPQKDSVRIEELINYFHYDYPRPDGAEQPFQPTVTVLPSPWKDGNKLIHIGIRGYDIAPDQKPRSNLVFLLDVSGSMNRPDKLPLMVNSMKLLLDTLDADDTVAIVTYAGRAGTVLAPTRVEDKAKILAALDSLRSGGSTAGAAGIRQAYALAKGNFDKKAVNRVILATDGDFNVGISNRDELKGFVERQRASGVFLSVLGFGQGNLNDQLMQTLAQNGNGVAAHIDTLGEARKVLVEEASSTLFPIAKDVKIQVEFNPATVAEYRLIGYETRALKREDFNNDKVDAGDIGSGHTVTAIYEITPVAGGTPLVDPSRYGTQAQPAGSDVSNEYAFLKIRYKLPKEDSSKLITTPIAPADERTGGDEPQLREARWSVAVAGFGQILKGGRYTGAFSYDDVLALARAARGPDEFGYRTEFLQLVRLARTASGLPNR